MNTGKEPGGDDRLKAELRRMKRAGAPWYFESELHQRLHGARHRKAERRRFGMSPVIGLTLLAFCLIVIASYVVVVNVNLAPQRAIETRNGLPQSQIQEAPPAVSSSKQEKFDMSASSKPTLRNENGKPADSPILHGGASAETGRPADTAKELNQAGRSALLPAANQITFRADSGHTAKAKDTLKARQDSLSPRTDSVHVPPEQTPTR